MERSHHTVRNLVRTVWVRHKTHPGYNALSVVQLIINAAPAEGHPRSPLSSLFRRSAYLPIDATWPLADPSLIELGPAYIQESQHVLMYVNQIT